MSKKRIEPVVQVAGTLQNAAEILSRRVAALGGNYTEALVRIGMGEKQYDDEIGKLAEIYAGISGHSDQRREIIVPEGGRVHIVRVLVDESLGWDVAIDAGFPDTPSNYDVRKVAGLYPPKRGAKVVKREIILVNFGTAIPNTGPVVAWGKENHLLSASPRTVFSLGRHKPQLHTELGQKVLVVVSFEECMFSGRRHVPCGWWCGGLRGASLGWPDGRWRDRCWFAFVNE